MLTRGPFVVQAALLFFAFILSGCSLRSGSVSQSLHLDLSKLSSVRATARALTSPQGVSYACLGVSVTGIDIGDSPGLQCGHPGVIAGPIDPNTSTVDLLVPSGPARKVTVFGIGDPSLCSMFDAKSLHAAKSLGSSPPFDFFDDASVAVKLDFNSALAFPDCNPSLPTTGATFSLNNGLLHTPTGVAVDSAQGYLYVANYSDGSLSKFDLATGSLIGSVGSLSGSTGTCAQSGVASSWCTGGTFYGTGSGNFMKSPRGIALDPTGSSLYVADTTNYRVVKYDASTGAFMGWIGKINTSPTAGASGCNGATAGMVTPGWCIGGSAALGSQDGMMNSPGGVAVDSSGNIYVTDTGNHRISKYSSSGTFLGWIGRIGTSPTGGAAGCNGAAVGTSTPGWCTGGTSAGGQGDGMLQNPQNLLIDANGTLYVADTVNHRISKYSGSTGAFQGWIGDIAISPTGGASGCAGAPAGTFTPGWCIGGTSQSGSADGAMNIPYGLSIDSSNSLYVVDSSNNRINKYTSAGQYQGSIGKVSGSTGSCPAVGLASLWCTGGSFVAGVLNGAFTNPNSVAIDPTSGHLFVLDSNGLQRPL